MLPDPLPANPLPLFVSWFNDANTRHVTDNPNAMVLATVDTSVSPPQPSARVVLCKEIDEQAGIVVFYTNYQSRKGEELLANPQCSVVFHWDNDERQIRIEGMAVPSPAAQSDAYYASRHPGSRVGAWASAQSQPLAQREQLIDQVREQARRFGVPLNDQLEAQNVDVDIPRPAHWGGFQLWIQAIEIWHGGSHRVHDRARYTRDLNVGDDGKPDAGGTWHATRLQP
ncbi:MAG: pyridoxamine 5'-phosphate oxidase [Gammaproteobacteria bacterium]